MAKDKANNPTTQRNNPHETARRETTHTPRNKRQKYSKILTAVQRLVEAVVVDMESRHRLLRQHRQLLRRRKRREQRGEPRRERQSAVIPGALPRRVDGARGRRGGAGGGEREKEEEETGGRRRRRHLFERSRVPCVVLYRTRIYRSGCFFLKLYTNTVNTEC